MQAITEEPMMKGARRCVRSDRTATTIDRTKATAYGGIVRS